MRSRGSEERFVKSHDGLPAVSGQAASFSSRMLEALVRWAGQIAAHPAVYDFTQILAGRRTCDKHLAGSIAECGAYEHVLDLGGGTGTTRVLFSNNSKYICLDIEMPKLRGFLGKYPGGMAVCGDAAQLPLRAGDVDLVLLCFVSHHLPDEVFDRALQEVKRILRPGGHFILMDPVLAPRRLMGRWLWRLDRGAYPRNREALLAQVSKHFKIAESAGFRVFHEYVICRAAV
jgi:SAM-dependent methyltransferase